MAPPMKTLPTTGIALISTALGIALYHAYAQQQWQQRDAEWAARLDQITANVNRMAEQAVSRLADEREKSTQAAIAKALQLERLAGVVHSMDGLRTDIAVYFAERGELPRTLADMQYPSDWLPNAHLARVEMHEGGVIDVHLRPESGLNGSVRFAPNLRGDPPMMLGWMCSSADFEQISQVSAYCQYAP